MEGLRRILASTRLGCAAVGDRAPLAGLIGLHVNWPLALLALVATIVTLVLLVPMLRRPKEREAPPAPSTASGAGLRSPVGARLVRRSRSSARRSRRRTTLAP